MWVQIPFLPLSRLDGETEIISRFYREGPGSIPGRAAEPATNADVARYRKAPLLASLLFWGVIHTGANPVVGSCDYVVNQKTRDCAGQHDSLRNCRTRFDSWTGYSGGL